MKLCRKKLHTRPDNLKRCPECIRISDRLRYPIKKKAQMKERYSLTRDQQIAYATSWNKQNPDKKLKNQISYQKRNPDKVRALQKKYMRSRQIRTPKWLTKSDFIEINWAYAHAQELTRITGIKHEVDHIIPLQGKNISGLHCPQNLKIITKSENSRKGSTFGKVG